MNSKYFLLLLMPVLVTGGQLLLKKSTSSVVTGKGFLNFIRSCLNPWLISAGILTAAAPLLYIGALDEVPLSKAFAFNSLNYILVYLSGHFILKERVNLFQIAGVLLITIGFLFPFIAGAAGA